ncbi:UNVERIFIED_CONTAM: hypothetical protein HDU68_002016, partial [Siphonaria sp. JEL0065]
YGGYTTSSTATSLSLSPLSGSNVVFAFDMTNQTVASSYIVYFQPYSSDILVPTADLTIPRPTPTSTFSNNTTSTTATTTLPVPFPDDSAFIYPTPPPTYFSNIKDEGTMGPCIVDPINCLNFAFVGVDGGVFYYGGGQSNLSTTNQFWFLDTSVDGMWNWKNMYNGSAAKQLPAWWNVRGFLTGTGELQFVLPFQDDARTGGLIQYHLKNSTYDLALSTKPNITDYYVQKPNQPQPAVVTTGIAIALGLGAAIIISTGLAVMYFRRRAARQRRQTPYGAVESHTPEPQITFSPLAPRRSLFKMSTERISRSPVPKEPPFSDFGLEESTNLGGNSGAGSSSSTLNDSIQMNTFSATSSPALPPPRNRIIASWRVLTGAHPIVTPSSATSGSRSVSGRGPPSVESDESHSSSEGAVGGSLNSQASNESHQQQGIVTSSVTSTPRAGFFRPPQRTVTNNVVVAHPVADGHHDLPSYDAAMLTSPIIPQTGLLSDNIGAAAAEQQQQQSQDADRIQVISTQQPTETGTPPPTTTPPPTNAVIITSDNNQQQAIVVGPHSPVGKDEIELRVGDHISLIPDPSDSPHSSFIRGLNLNSGRTGLFPRHCIIMAAVNTTDPHHLAALGIVQQNVPLSTDISWWREQAVRFNHALTNPANTNVIVSGGGGVGDDVGGTPGLTEKGGGGGGGVPQIQSPQPQTQQISSIIAPLVPPVQQQTQQVQHQFGRGTLAGGIAAPRIVVGGNIPVSNEGVGGGGEIVDAGIVSADAEGLEEDQ